jgi:hypothetical protein
MAIRFITSEHRNELIASSPEWEHDDEDGDVSMEQNCFPPGVQNDDQQGVKECCGTLIVRTD